MPFAATWMVLEIVILSEVRQTNSAITLTCGILNDTNELIFKKRKLQMQKTNLWLTGSKWGGKKLGEQDAHIHTTTYKTDTKDLLHSTGNSILCNGMYGKRNLQKGNTHTHSQLIHFIVYLKLTPHCKSTILQNNFQKTKDLKIVII